nr:MADS-box transcription factor [Tanacetum cinerariifolium]
MGCAKLRMELIKKEKTRITTYHKRKLGILKKAIEFSILCDRGHILGVGRVLLGQGTIIPPTSQSTHSDDIARLKKREKLLTKQATCRPRNLSPATSRPGFPEYVAGENGKCCSAVHV